MDDDRGPRGRRTISPIIRPQRSAVLLLVPLTDQARGLLNYAPNANMVRNIRDPNNPRRFIRVLEVVSGDNHNAGDELASIGRDGTIKIPVQSYPSIQCSIEWHPNNANELSLTDHTVDQSTVLSGEAATPFRNDNQDSNRRRVVIDCQVNREFGFGGARRQRYAFRIEWNRDYGHPSASAAISMIQAGSADILNTFAHRRRPTRLRQDPGPNMRYSFRQLLGSGAFGLVYKVCNVDDGRYLAVKLIPTPHFGSHAWTLLQREAAAMKMVAHGNIVPYVRLQPTDAWVELFIELKHGSAQDLLAAGRFRGNHGVELARLLCRDMLRALVCLGKHNIVHRDVKPANILYTLDPTTRQYRFSLADFGLCVDANMAQTMVGTPLFEAPELEHTQTLAVDVWSLFVTLAYLLDLLPVISNRGQLGELRAAILQAAHHESLRDFGTMAIEEPSQRAKAADILQEVFGGTAT